MSTTPEDRLYDALRDAAAAYLLEHGIESGIDGLAESMKQTAMDELANMKCIAEAAADTRSLTEKVTDFWSALSSFDTMLAAEMERQRQLSEGVNRPLGTEPQS